MGFLYELAMLGNKFFLVFGLLTAACSGQFGVKAEECKNRWKNIRDTFMRRKRNKKMPTGSARTQKKRKWYLEEYLVFLDQVESERETLSNTTAQEEMTEIENYTSDEDSHSQTEAVVIENSQENIDEATKDLEGSTTTMTESMMAQPSGSGSESKLNFNKRTRQEKACIIKKRKATDKIVEIFQKNSEERQKLWSKFEKAADEHPIDVFCRSIATSVKKMSEERQVRAKMQTCQIIGQLELEELASRSAPSRPTSGFSSYDDISCVSSVGSPDFELDLLTNSAGPNFT